MSTWIPAAAGALAGLAMVLSDVMTAVLTGSSGLIEARLLVHSALAWALAGATTAPLLVPWLHLPDRVVRALGRRGALASPAKRAAARAFLVALLPALLLSWPLSLLFEGPWVADTWLGAAGPSLSTLGVWGLLFAGTFAFLQLRGARVAWRMTGAAACLLAGAVALWIDKAVLPGLYPPFHLVLTLLAGAVLCGGALLVLPRGPKLPSAARSVLAGVLCGSVFCLAATHLFHEGDLRRRAVTGQLSVERLIHLVQAAADLDGDGVSPLLGGGDCDDLSASINPLRRDLPGNHVDEDCDGRDSTEAEVRQAALAWQAHGDASFDAGSNARRLREAAATGHILLITVDALRRDHALDDHGALLLPSLQVLPGPAVTATRAMAPGTTTQLSLPAMLTGRFDYDNARSSLVLDLRREGVDTLLVTHRAVLDQLAQGNFGESYPPFDVSSHFDRVIGVGPAAGEGWGGGITRGSTGEMLEAFLAAWDGMGSGRRFCWLHFFDPHQWNQLEEVQHLDGPKDRYRAVLAEVDRAVRQVLGELLRRGDGERLLILFSSDHGEGLGDRNIRYHTKLAYGVLAEVPLLLWARGLQPRLLDTPVSLMDLRPTLHALVTGRPCAECEGCSLVGAFDDPSWTRPAPILISEYYQQAVVSGTLKLIVDRFSHTMELYDLAADPLETMDLSRRQPDELARLLGLLKASPHYREPEGRALR